MPVILYFSDQGDMTWALRKKTEKKTMEMTAVKMILFIIEFRTEAYLIRLMLDFKIFQDN